MRDNITDWALEQYHGVYEDNSITKEDIFYYVYGILHHPEYRAKYQTFLVRGLPNIPLAPDFRAFSKAGRELADLHLNFETGPRYDLGQPINAIPNAPKKLAFGKKKNLESHGPKQVQNHSELVADDQTVYDNLPHIRYKVNGGTPVQWFVDRYKFTTHSKSGITNYPLEGKTGDEVRAILERLVYVGVKSDEVIACLPKEFEMDVGMDDEPHHVGLDHFSKVTT